MVEERVELIKAKNLRKRWLRGDEGDLAEQPTTEEGEVRSVEATRFSDISPTLTSFPATSQDDGMYSMPSIQ